jgi:tetratricopeptide (TPR) repeat protein
MRKLLLAALALLLFAAAAAGQDGTKAVTEEEIRSAFDQGLLLHDAGKFTEAAASYDQIVAAGHRNGHVFYNLALAHYRSGDFGRAMAAVLAARELLPRDPDVRSNLKFLEGRIQDKLSATPALPAGERIMNFWVGGLSTRELVLVNLLAMLLAAAAVVVFFALPRLKPYKLRSLWALGLPVLAGLLLLTKLSLQTTWGAIIPDGAKIYSGPADSNTLLFNLNAGAPVQVGETTSGGYRIITLSDGKKGWVAEKDLAVF